jgi:NADH-quinone oxidoreductase subunit L
LESTLSTLLLLAWLLPLASFCAILFCGSRLGAAGRGAGYLATAAILASFVLSVAAMFCWIGRHGVAAGHHADASDSGHAIVVPAGRALESSAPRSSAASHASVRPVADAAHPEQAGPHAGGHGAAPKAAYFDDWYTLVDLGNLKITIGYYIDALTVLMFCMVTLIATCIHFYAIGYMHEELEAVTDHEVTLSNGEHLHRKGRYFRFFQYLSLFCFSMLGIVIAGNIAMTFIFWELVGICSYFLIGFYIERKSASTAANKAFIVNRIGDFGMIIGLMALWGSLGTFSFGGEKNATGEIVKAGMFEQARPVSEGYRLKTPAGMVKSAKVMGAEDPAYTGHLLLVVAGLGIFCGCVGKSAQFPLHVWLPDAMEGPTPVSALVHSATMVAAGVFLVGRFYPMFTPEVLLVIAILGCITLFMAATIAITATDIKRVLAYSTLSQLGYMMFALGVGGWVAGMLHLITHAFFKSLLFMCSGSVIHAVHTNEMPEMGGLRRKMPITATTMLIGCLAIIGAGVPTIVGLSGYYSKDAILAQALHFGKNNAAWNAMFYVAAGGAAITAFYMFRLWFMTFIGPPRDKHRYEHAHESPRVMWMPLAVLAFFAVFVAMPADIEDFTNPAASPLVQMLEQARPDGTGVDFTGQLAAVMMPNEHGSHDAEIHLTAGMIAFGMAMAGLLLACCIYWWRLIDPAEVRSMFAPIYRFLLNKWWFDELYDKIFVRPTLWCGRCVAGFDRDGIDWLVDNLAVVTRRFTGGFDHWIDQIVIDGSVNWTARKTYAIGLWLRKVQTGRLRQYVVFIIVGTVAMYLVATFGLTN